MSKNKDNDELLRAQIESLIRDEIQEGINDYIDDKEAKKEKAKETGLGFAAGDDEEGGELNVKIRVSEVDKILKEYKRIKRQERSAFGQIKKLGLVDKHGQPLESDIEDKDVKENKKGITGKQTFKT
tara:strand:+ start:659 stop:1039 length:381 start_codon:yes stop_codon:yes gene_type:complete